MRYILSKNVRKSMKKVEIIGTMVCIAFGTFGFEASASNKENDIMIEKLQTYDELQNIFYRLIKILRKMIS